MKDSMVRSKIWEPLVTPKYGLLNFYEIGVKKNYSIRFLKSTYFLGFRSLDPEMFIASAPGIVSIRKFFKTSLRTTTATAALEMEHVLQRKIVFTVIVN